MKTNSSFVPRYVLILFVICLVTLASTAFTNYQNLEKVREHNQGIENSWGITNHLQTLNLLILEAESSLRGYYLSGNPALLSASGSLREKVGEQFKQLELLLGDNPVQSQNLAQLKELFQRKLMGFEETNRVYDSGGLEGVAQTTRSGNGMDIMDEVRVLNIIMEKEEQQSLQAQREQFYSEYQRALWIGMGTTILSILILILFFRLIHTGFVRQRAVEERLQKTNDNLEHTVITRTSQLSELSRHLLRVSEEEKASLARELHDEMGSSLTAISMGLSNVIDRIKDSDPLSASQLTRAKQGLLEAVDLKRRIIEDLRPSLLDILGLPTSIQSHAEKIASLAQWKLETDIDQEIDDLDPSSAIAMFRIVQEALNNAVKYAQASQVRISLKKEGKGLRLIIADNGIGISADDSKKPSSYGLLGVRERAFLSGGTMKLEKGLNHRGVAINVFMPINNASA